VDELDLSIEGVNLVFGASDYDNYLFEREDSKASTSIGRCVGDCIISRSGVALQTIQ
jgi:hypothetical protein